MKCPGCGSNMRVTANSVFKSPRKSDKNDTVALILYCRKQHDKSDPCQVKGNYIVDVSGFSEWIKEGARRTIDVRIEDYETKEVGA